MLLWYPSPVRCPRERLWMLNVCAVMGVQVLTAISKPWLLKKFPIIASESVEALRHMEGKVIIAKMKCNMEVDLG